LAANFQVEGPVIASRFTVHRTLLIWGVYALIRFSRRPRQGDQTDEVRRILDERLARGEISPEEHQRIFDLLTGSGTLATSQKSF
jgi:uncharacterized membrane protein